MNFFKQIKPGLKRLWTIITSQEARSAVEQAAALVEIALPIVDQLSIIDPRMARLRQVVNAYESTAFH
jgi:hypothetical protein